MSVKAKSVNKKHWVSYLTLCVPIWALCLISSESVYNQYLDGIIGAWLVMMFIVACGCFIILVECRLGSKARAGELQ